MREGCTETLYLYCDFSENDVSFKDITNSLIALTFSILDSQVFRFGDNDILHPDNIIHFRNVRMVRKGGGKKNQRRNMRG